MGEFLALKTVIHSTISSPFMAEEHAKLQVVKLEISLGFQSIDILGDSRTVIKKSNSTATDKSILGAIIRYIQNKKTTFPRNQFTVCSKIRKWLCLRTCKRSITKMITKVHGGSKYRPPSKRTEGEMAKTPRLKSLHKRSEKIRIAEMKDFFELAIG